MIAPPNTPKERYSSSLETDSTSASPSTLSARAFKVSKLARELRAVLAPSPPSQELSFHLHNLGYEDYDRVEQWRYRVFHEMSLNTADTPVSTRGTHCNPTSFSRKRKYKRAKSTPWKSGSGAWSADSSSSLTGEERDAVLIQRMDRLNWQKSPVKYEVPNPKFLQKLFV